MPSPVFILSAMRSGSTLLRCVLDTHSRVHAPHELHLTRLTVSAERPSAALALDALGLTERDAEHLLWDRLLHLALTRSGKSVLVEKTPPNVLHWRRISACWPRARYIFLLRHPVHILNSMLRATHGEMGEDARRALGARADPWARPDTALEALLPMLRELAAARAALPGLTVRYEDLTSEPEQVVRTVCAHLGVPWEPEMLHYGRADHGPFKVFLGDASMRIASGRIQPARRAEATRDVPGLRQACLALDYPC